MCQEQVNKNSTDLSAVFEELEGQIPNQAKIEIKSEKPKTSKVNEYNQAIINTYLEGEASHLQQQKPVSIIIAISVSVQLIAFNVLIYFITLKEYDMEKMRLLLDFMKYYIGAVIVEMLGMCWFVVKGIYSASIGKMVEHIIKRKK